MAEYITKGQSNYGWSLTWDAAGRYPIIAKRRFSTLADAQAFVDDKSKTATATEGLIISVINDTVAKNNGVYYVKSVANTDAEYGAILDKGELVKVGGAETEVAENYTAATVLSQTLVVGQLIKVINPIEVGEGEEKLTYQAGFYIVEGPGVISALATSTGSDDEVGALKTRVTNLETGKVDKVEGSRLMTNEEGAKLSGIAEGAEVNFVKSVGDNLSVDGDGKLTVDISSKVDKSTYETAVGTINGELATKASAQDLADHKANANIHVTLEDKAAWNNAEQNAKDYADTIKSGLETKISAETEARETLAGVVATKADASALEGYVKVEDAYNDAEVRQLISAETTAREAAISAETEAREALAQTVADNKTSAESYADAAAASALTDAKTYADGLNSAMDTRVKGLEAIDFEQIVDDKVTIAFNDFATAVTDDNTVNTYKELVDYAAKHSSDIVELIGVVDKKAEQEDLLVVSGAVEANATAIAKNLEDIATISGAVEANATAIAKNLEDIAKNAESISKNAEDIAAEVEAREALAQTVAKNAEDIAAEVEAREGAISAEAKAREELAGIVATKADAESVYTKDEADAKFLTGVTFDAELSSTSENAVQNKTVHAEFVKVRDEIQNVVAGDVTAALANYIKKDQLNTLNDIALYGDSAVSLKVLAGDGVVVDTDKDNKTITVKAKVAEDADNALKVKEDGSLFVQTILIEGDDVETLA